MAWLHATPEGSKKSRLKSFKDLDENSSFLKLPDIEGAEYMVSLLSEVGFVMGTGMGVVPITWTELTNWLNATGLNLSVWEKLTLKEMSEVYASELSQATAKDHPAPYVYAAEAAPEDVEVQRQQVASKLKNVFASFKRGKGNPETQPK